MFECLLILLMTIMLFVTKWHTLSVIMAAEWFFSLGTASFFIWVTGNGGGFESILALHFCMSVVAVVIYASMKAGILSALYMVTCLVIWEAMINDTFYDESYSDVIYWLQALMILCLVGTIYGGRISNRCCHYFGIPLHKNKKGH